ENDLAPEGRKQSSHIARRIPARRKKRRAPHSTRTFGMSGIPRTSRLTALPTVPRPLPFRPNGGIRCLCPPARFGNAKEKLFVINMLRPTPGSGVHYKQRSPSNHIHP